MPVLYSWKTAWGAETPEWLWIEVVGGTNLVFRPDAVVTIVTGQPGGWGAGMETAVWSLASCLRESLAYRNIGAPCLDSVWKFISA